MKCERNMGFVVETLAVFGFECHNHDDLETKQCLVFGFAPVPLNEEPAMTMTPPDPAAELAPTGFISSQQPAVGQPAASPPATKRLLPSLLAASLTLFATYGGLIAILLPVQVALLDPAHKVGNLAIVTTTSFVFTLFAQPLAGAFSDRDNARRVVARLGGSNAATIEPIERNGAMLYRVVLPGGPSEDQAWALRDRIAAQGFDDARVLRPF